MNPPLHVRWTVGAVSARGLEALGLSIRGAQRVFGSSAEYTVCVNSLPLSVVQHAAAPIPRNVAWRSVSHGDIPAFIRDRFGDHLAEGAAWKLAPLRLAPDAYELSLDNDCILWDMPSAIREWLASDRCLLAADARRANGRFDPWCPQLPLNSGIRGLPPALDFGAALRTILARVPPDAPLTSELDEQGLQVAAASLHAAPLVVPLEDVTICSPFHPFTPDLGRCGAHFVGLNARHIPWTYFDRPADDCMREHWEKHLPTLERLTSTPATRAA